MNPARKILLVAKDDDAVAPLRYVLRNSTPRFNYSCYEVTTVASTEKALQALRTNQYDVLLCKCPIASMEALLGKARDIDDRLKLVVLADKKSILASVYVDSVLFKPRMAELLEHIRILVRHKRGPRPGWKEGAVAGKEEVAA